MRESLIGSVYERAKVRSVRMFGYDDAANTYEIKLARRDSKRYVRGSLKVPRTCKAVCAEGDDTWTELPGALTVRAEKVAAAASGKELGAKTTRARYVDRKRM